MFGLFLSSIVFSSTLNLAELTELRGDSYLKERDTLLSKLEAPKGELNLLSRIVLEASKERTRAPQATHSLRALRGLMPEFFLKLRHARPTVSRQVGPLAKKYPANVAELLIFERDAYPLANSWPDTHSPTERLVGEAQRRSVLVQGLIHGLGQSGHAIAQETLQYLATRSDERMAVRVGAVLALGTAPSNSPEDLKVLSFLEDLMNDEAAPLEMRYNAVLALGKIGGVDVIPKLNIALRDAPSPLKLAATHALSEAALPRRLLRELGDIQERQYWAQTLTQSLAENFVQQDENGQRTTFAAMLNIAHPNTEEFLKKRIASAGQESWLRRESKVLEFRIARALKRSPY